MNPITRNQLGLGCWMACAAVLLGAFGAHGLKSLVTPEKLVTFETGVRYHFYHALALILLGILSHLWPELKSRFSTWAFGVGILLFSFNCYFYTISGIKIFALLVPIGGTLFILGWAVLGWKLLKFRQ